MAWKPKLAVSLQMSFISKICLFYKHWQKHLGSTDIFLGQGFWRQEKPGLSRQCQGRGFYALLLLAIPSLPHIHFLTHQLSKQVTSLYTTVPMVMEIVQLRDRSWVIHTSFVNTVLHGFKILWDSTLEILWDSWRKFPAKIPVIITFFHWEQNDLGTQTLPVDGLTSKH